MTTKLVVRLLDIELNLLGWTSVLAAARGDGMLRAVGPVAVRVEQAGTCALLSVHWCDINVEATTPIIDVKLKEGGVFVCFEHGAPMIIVGPTPPYLPPVTVKSVAVEVPVGQLGTRGNA